MIRTIKRTKYVHRSSLVQTPESNVINKKKYLIFLSLLSRYLLLAFKGNCKENEIGLIYGKLITARILSNSHTNKLAHAFQSA